MTSQPDQVLDQQRQSWERFAAGWKRWNTRVGGWLAPVGAAMIRQAEVRDTSLILDVASGAGEPGLTAAALAPQGRVTLTDLSPRMLAVAAESAAARGLHHVDTHVCDAGALPFPDRSFDVVLCRFGFMFFPDVTAAGEELARVARPGAQVSAAVWGEPQKNPWATTIMGTIARHIVVPAPAPRAPGLFRCAPAGFMREVFTEAGLEDIVEEEVSCDLISESAEQYWEFMTDIAAPVVAGLAAADAGTQEVIRAEVLNLAHDYASGDQVRMRSTATVIAGTRSA